MAKDFSSLLYAFICIQLLVSVSGETCGAPPAAGRSKPCEKRDPPFPVGKSIKYCCDAGFKFGGGNKFAICRLNKDGTASWDIPDLHCQPVSCSPPDQIPNGRVSGSRYTFPNSVKYECNKGYKLRGLNQRYCETTGEWSGRIPTCQIITCPPPDEIENGKVSFQSTDYSSTATYECSYGFGIKGNSTRRCTHEGVWEGDTPTCDEIICPEPVDPIDGKVILINGGRRKGDSIVYTCNEGTTLRGADSATCMEDGRWSAGAPICGRPCTLPKLYRGKLGTIERGWRQNSWVFKEREASSSIEAGETILLRCNRGFELPVEDLVPGDIVVVCDNGILKPTPSCHPAWCRGPLPDDGIGTPPSPPYNKENGSVVEYEDACLNVGKTLQKKKAVCYRGTWSITEAHCQDLRCKADQLENLSVDTEGRKFYDNGERVQVKCKNRYEQSSEVNSIRCSNGQWEISNNSPCKPASCRYPPPTIQGARANVLSGNHGTVVTYSCSPPYQLVERNPITCSYGQWTGEIPACIDSRCSTTNLVRYDGVKSENKIIADKMFYTPLCMDGYDSLEVQLQCNKGTWGSDRIHKEFCVPGDCIVPYVAYGQFFKLIIKDRVFWQSESLENVKENTVLPHNTHLYFICTENRKFQGKFKTSGKGVKVTCKKKQWIPKPECWFFPQTTTVVPMTTDKPIGNLSDAKEAEFLIPDGNGDNLAASNNTDNEMIPNMPMQNFSRNCEFNSIDQHLLVFLNNRIISNGILPHGSHIKFGCQPVGYSRLSGPDSADCVEGKWEPQTFPTCITPSGEKSVVISFLTSSTYDTYPGNVVRVPKHSRVDIQCYELNRRSWPRLTCVSPTGEISSRNAESYNIAYTHIVIWNLTEEVSGICSCSSDNDSHTITILTNENIDLQDVVCPQLNSTHRLSIRYDPPLQTIFLDTGTKAYFNCRDERYELRGNVSATCLENGKWSSDLPICVPLQTTACPRLDTTRRLSVNYYPSPYNILPDTKAYFACTDARAELKGDEILTCLENGKWSNDPPICVQRCWPLSGIYNGNKVGDSFSVGSVVTYECHRGFKLVGAREIICREGGTWSNAIPRCTEIRCPVPRKIPNGHVHYTSLQLDSETKYTCNRGYKLNGPSKLQCMDNGKWNKEPPFCEEISVECSSHDLQESLPHGVYGTNVTAEFMPVGSVVQLVCDGASLVMIGSKYASCTSKGFWNFGDTKCVPGCSAIEVPPDSSLIIENVKEIYRFGDYLTFSCPEDEELSIDLERIVCLGNGWSDKRVPTCISVAA